MTERRALEPTNAELETKLGEVEDKLSKVESKVDLMIIRTDELILAYSTAKGVTSFVKWLAGVVTAAGILWTTLLGGKFPHS